MSRTTPTTEPARPSRNRQRLARQLAKTGDMDYQTALRVVDARLSEQQQARPSQAKTTPQQPTLADLHSEQAALMRQLEDQGGRGIELAEAIDRLSERIAWMEGSDANGASLPGGYYAEDPDGSGDIRIRDEHGNSVDVYVCGTEEHEAAYDAIISYRQSVQTDNGGLILGARFPGGTIDVHTADGELITSYEEGSAGYRQLTERLAGGRPQRLAELKMLDIHDIPQDGVPCSILLVSVGIEGRLHYSGSIDQFDDLDNVARIAAEQGIPMPIMAYEVYNGKLREVWVDAVDGAQYEETPSLILDGGLLDDEISEVEELVAERRG